MGKLQLPALQGLIYTDFFSQTIILLPFVVIIIFGLVTGQIKTFIAEINYRYILLIFGLVMYMVSSLMQTFSKKGFYENGVVTAKGVLLYTDITAYTFSMDYKNGKLRISFNPRGSSGMYLVVEDEFQDAIKTFLRRNCKLKENAENLRKKSLFKSKKKIAAEEEAAAKVRKSPTQQRKKKKKKK